MLKTFQNLVWLVLWGTGTASLAQQPLSVDRYVARVNDRVITASDVLAIVQPLQMDLQKTLSGKELEEKVTDLYNRTLDRLIERALILEEFEKSEHGLPTPVVEDRIQEIIRTQFGNNEAAFLTALKSEGRTLEAFRTEMRDDMTVMSLRREMVNQFSTVSPAAIQAEYQRRKDEYSKPEQVRIRMILAKLDDDHPEEAARSKLVSVLTQLKAGEDFAKCAREQTEGPKADEGGDLGWIPVSNLRPEFKQALDAMIPGDFSGILNLGDSLAIIKLEEHQEARTVPLREVQADIENELVRAEEKVIYADWIKRLYKKHHVLRY